MSPSWNSPTPHLRETRSTTPEASSLLHSTSQIPRHEKPTDATQGAQHVALITSWEAQRPETVEAVAGRFDVQAKGSACLHCPNVQTRCQARALRASSRLRTALPLPQKAQFRPPHSGGGYVRAPRGQWSENMTANL